MKMMFPIPENPNRITKGVLILITKGVLILALTPLLLLQACATNPIATDVLPQLEPGEGIAGISFDSSVHLTSIQFDGVSGATTNLRIPEVPLGQSIFLFVVPAGGYCLQDHSLAQNGISLSSTEHERCFEVEAGKLSYSGTFVLTIDAAGVLSGMHHLNGLLGRPDRLPIFHTALSRSYPHIAAAYPPVTASSLPVIHPTQEEKALAAAKKRAATGDFAADREVGMRYMIGNGAPKDPAEGVKWLTKSAEGGDVDAQVLLGAYYEEGKDIPRDPARAFALFLMAAKQGRIPAETTVGYDYLYGIGTGVDYPQALTWSKKASDQGDSNATMNLGYMYGEGVGVPEDDATSIGWYKVAAQRGNRRATLFLALVYRLGMYGVAKDHVQAEQYYAQAATGVMYDIDEMSEVMKEIVDGHKTYPRDAAAAKQGGVVTLEFDCPGRTPENIKVAQSSGFELLDEAAYDAVRDSTFPGRIPALNSVQHFTVKVNFDPMAPHLPIGP